MSYLRDGDTAASLTREALHISDEQVRREQAIKEDDLVQRLCSGVYGIHRIELCVEAAREIERLRAQLAEQDRDAERYRWLRDVGDNTWTPLMKRGPAFASNLDAAIDAAMAERA